MSPRDRSSTSLALSAILLTLLAHLPATSAQQTTCSTSDVFTAVDIPNFDSEPTPRPASSLCECSSLCDTARPGGTCDFFAFGDNQCWFKVTRKVPGMFTRFRTMDRVVDGDIPNFDLRGPFETANGEECFNECTRDAACHWVNFRVLENNPAGRVLCWLKTAQGNGNRNIGYPRTTGSGSNFQDQNQCTSGFRLLPSFDIRDFDAADPRPAIDACDCANQCEANSSVCEFFSFGEGRCWFKRTAKITNNKFTQFRDADNAIPGDIPNFDLRGPFTSPSAQECHAQCTQDPACHFANWEQQPAGPVTCWLKTATPVANSGRILGYRLRVGSPFDPRTAGRFEVVGNSGIVGIHAVVVPRTDEVLFFQRPEYIRRNPNQGVFVSANHPNGELAALYNWAANNYTVLPIPDNPFCAGHSLLANGDVAIFGGDIAKDRFRNLYQDGRQLMRVYRSQTKTWEIVGQLASKRWYPTQVTLPSGTVFTIGGTFDDWNPNGSQDNPTYELFNPSNPSVPPQEFRSPFLLRTSPFNTYPLVYILPQSGNLFMFANTDGEIFDAERGMTVENVPKMAGGISVSHPHTASAVMLPLMPETGYAPEVAIFGGSRTDVGNSGLVSDQIARISVADGVSGRAWELDRMPIPRIMHNAVLLPDGTVFLTSGAQRGESGGNAGQGSARDPAFTSVIYDPTAPLGRRCRTVATASIERLYHNTAFLLPDGRVMTAGSDQQFSAGATNPYEYRLEAYSPPYLFAGTRPVLESAPDAVVYGQTFEVVVSGVDITKAALIAPSATTHATDMGQRYIGVTVRKTGVNRFELTAPPNANVAPPQVYMLFVLSAENIPSKALWVQLTR